MSESELQAKILQLEAERQTLYAMIQKISERAFATQEIPHKDSKVPLPERFAGNSKELRHFLQQVELVFKVNPTRFPTDSMKVGIVGTLLTGKARAWFTPMLENEDKYSEILNDYGKFKKQMLATFGERDRAILAVTQIRKLKQGARSANAYSAEFRSLATDLDWNDAALISQYRLGLNDEVKDFMIHYDLPRTLEEVIAIAVTCDNRVFERRQERIANTGIRKAQETSGNYDAWSNGKSQGAENAPKNSSQLRDAVPMEIDAVKRGPLPEAERQRRRLNNLCIYCGSDSHFRKNCPAANKRTAYTYQLNETETPENSNSH